MQPVAAAQAALCVSGSIELVNGGFESPVVNPGFPRTVAASQVPGWTPSPEDRFEIWPPGVAEADGAYTATGGIQFIELNVSELGEVSQVVATTPGQVVLFEEFHHGRSAANTAELTLGPQGDQDTDRLEVIMTDPPERWGRYAGSYQVPANQTSTRLAVTSPDGSDRDSIGNFLDGVRPVPAGCTVAGLAVTDLTDAQADHPGDIVELHVTGTNAGGFDVQAPTPTSTAPAGTGLTRGEFFRTDGLLVASTAQEVLIRTPFAITNR